MTQLVSKLMTEEVTARAITWPRFLAGRQSVWRGAAAHCRANSLRARRGDLTLILMTETLRRIVAAVKICVSPAAQAARATLR